MSNTQTPSLDGFRRSSRSLQPPESGELLRFTRQDVGWEWMSFLVRRLVPGQVWETRNAEEETVVLMLGGTSLADWGEGRQQIGQRKNVFDGLPYAVYLPAGFRLNLEALTECEFVACYVPSRARLEPRLIIQTDVSVILRAVGIASTQIVCIVRDDFAADKLMIIVE